MANIFIESRNYPQKHPIPLLFFKKSARQILQRIYSEEVLVPNLIEIKFIGDIIFLHRCSLVDLLQDLA